MASFLGNTEAPGLGFKVSEDGLGSVTFLEILKLPDLVSKVHRYRPPPHRFEILKLPDLVSKQCVLNCLCACPLGNTEAPGLGFKVQSLMPFLGLGFLEILKLPDLVSKATAFPCLRPVNLEILKLPDLVSKELILAITGLNQDLEILKLPDLVSKIPGRAWIPGRSWKY